MGGNVALALLGNTLPTGAILVALILAPGPISGAHFNPAVSLVLGLRKEHPWREFIPYAGAQILGECLGTMVAHGMFELPLFEVAIKARNGPAQLLAEFVATVGLLLTILAVSNGQRDRLCGDERFFEEVAGVSKNTGNSSRVGAVKERAQAKNPVTDRYVKIDTATGRIIDQKKTPGPYKGIKDVTKGFDPTRTK